MGELETYRIPHTMPEKRPLQDTCKESVFVHYLEGYVDSISSTISDPLKMVLLMTGGNTANSYAVSSFVVMFK